MNKMHFLILLSAFLLPSASLAQHENHNRAEIDHSSSQTAAERKKEGQSWTCSMHPQIRLKKPGQCPICNMDLISIEPETSSENQQGIPGITLDDSKAAQLELQTARVKREWVERPIRLVGQINYDETQVKHITAWVPGRIDRIFVDYTGLEVAKGDHMVSLYSPQLIAAQEELVQASRSVGRNSGSEMVKRSSRRTLTAAREKLKLLGLSPKQVRQIERRGSAENTVTVYSPIGGVVVEKHANVGAYIETGTRIYTIADLSNLWLNLDAYESDLPWIQYGQKVEFSAQAIPGQTFEGIISFVQPFLNEKTRTVRVRVNVKNTSKILKPGMFVTAKVQSRIDSEGKVVGASFTGKFICPMHPEIVEARPGDCPICGMKLAKAESLSYVGKTPKDVRKPPLIIPASAPLITGERAIVYVKRADSKRYEAREVVLGAKAGKFYTIASGLSEGEVVVSNGAFKLDADLQIRGAKSMMNPHGGMSSETHNH